MSASYGATRYSRLPGSAAEQVAHALRTPLPRAKLDRFTLPPILACVFALIVYPLLLFFTYTDPHALEARPEPRIFWPIMTAISVALALNYRSRLAFPAHIICLLTYLAFAGLSVLWSFSPDHSFIRYIQQVMVITSIVIPVILAARDLDITRLLFFCFAFSLIINVAFVLRGSVTMADNGAKLVDIGYEGYFEGKNYLGECATVAFLLALHETFQRGWRRVAGVVVGVVAIWLVNLSQSKTAFGLALLCPVLAWLTLHARRLTRASPALILLSIPICWIILSSISNFGMPRLSYMLYGDSTLTGRTTIWDFAQDEIGRRPLLGWGYQSFWLVPDSPSVSDAPGWVKKMPNAHNGYYDTMIEMGYVGLLLLLIFLLTTLHALGRIADRDWPRAQLLLTLTLFIILFNFFESLWMRGFEFLWVVFVIVAADIGRGGRVPFGKAANNSSRFRGRAAGPSFNFVGAQARRLP
jgi:O-antigen ligase